MKRKLTISIIIVFILCIVLSTGKELKFNTEFENLTGGDTIDVDLHLHYPLDSILNIINGQLGGDNLSDTASLRQSLIDSVYYTTSDWLYNYTRKWQHWSSGTFTGRFDRGAYFYINDTTANDQDFRIYIDSTKLVFLVNDDTTWARNMRIDTAQIDTAHIYRLKADTATVTRLKATNIYGTANFDILTDGDSLHVDNAKIDTLNSDSVKIRKGNIDTVYSNFDILTPAATAGYLNMYKSGGNQTFRIGDANSLQSIGLMNIYSGGIEKIRFNAGGASFINNASNFGIDTTAPGSKFHVAGSGRFRDSVFAKYGSIDTIDVYSAYIDTIKGNTYVTGGLGIGTTQAPTDGIVLGNSTGTENIQIYPGAETVGQIIWGASNEGKISYNMQNDYMAFDVNTDEAMRIIDGGFVGIDTTTPGSKLHVAGSGRIRDTTFTNVLQTSGRSIHKILNIGSAVEHTLVSNAITITASHIMLVAQGGSGTDTLSTISGGVDGDLIFVNVKALSTIYIDNSGNIYPEDGGTELSSAIMQECFKYDGANTKWLYINYDF